MTPDAIKAARNFAEKAKVKFAYSLTPATELILMFGEDKDIEHLVGLTAGPHTVALKDACAESNTLTVFIEPKNR